MTNARPSLATIVAKTAEGPASPALAAAARHVAGLHGMGAVAVIAYGSTLRGAALADTLVDLYVLTDDWGAVSANPSSRLACRLLPPNVAYAETVHEGATLRIKCAVLPLDRFAEEVQPATVECYFWARFAQPCRLVWAADEAAREKVVSALATAVASFIAAARPLAGDCADVLEVWRAGIAASYGCELRAESGARAAAIVAADPDYYRRAGEAALSALGRSSETAEEAQRAWARRRRRGKALSVLRLMKAAFTFSGGADYLAWKIARHSGVEVKLKPWQRRHPILGALVLLPGLMRKGAVR